MPGTPGKRNKRPDLNGLLIVDKPLGATSMDVIRRIRRATHGAKAGHAGTLDPLATGVVVCCLGKATKAVTQLMSHTKVYETVVDLSALTTTDDREGERTEVAVAEFPTMQQVQAVLPEFVGDIQQTPPAYSAIHIDGQRAYKLARQGQDIQIQPRTVHIDAIDLLGLTWPNLSLRITCGKGTYIRSLGRDIGQALGTGGHLAALRRTVSGSYTVAQAIPWERLDQPIEAEDLLPIPVL